MIPGVSTGNLATESMHDSEAVQRIMERHTEVTKAFRETEFLSKISRAAGQQNRIFNNVRYEQNDLVFYQEKDGKRWCGPVRVQAHRGREVWLWANGSLKNVSECSHIEQIQNRLKKKTFPRMKRK